MPRVIRSDVSIATGTHGHIMGSIARVIESARSDFEKFAAAKQAVFERYLETRVNWLRRQLEREAGDAIHMNNLDFLRKFKPQALPKTSPSFPVPLTSLKTIRRIARQPRASRTIAKAGSRTLKRVAPVLVSSTPLGPVPAKAARTLSRVTATASRRDGLRTRRENNMFSVAPTIYSADSTVFTSTGTPVRNPFSNLSESVIEEINKILRERVEKKH